MGFTPQKFREWLLNEIHEEHPGICRMNALARSYLWWPQLDKAIETKVKSCEVCAAAQNSPPTSPLYSWNWPSRIWQHINIDIAQKGNNTFLVLINSHSKWLEVVEKWSITAEKTCDVLYSIFASYGFPEEIVRDNGPQFTAAVFRNLLSRNGIKQTLVPPYHQHPMVPQNDLCKF